MASKQFSMTFTVAAGVPGAVTASGQNTPDNGVYTINYSVDNNGPRLQIVTPDGTLEQHGNLGLVSGYAGE
jgi:hypothetical protein